jgi:hypothetical protein
MATLSPHQLKTYTKIAVIAVFSVLCLMLQAALLVLLFIGGSFNDILPWTITVITVYFGVIKMLVVPTSSSSSNSVQDPAYFTPTPSPNPYVNQPSTPEHHSAV